MFTIFNVRVALIFNTLIAINCWLSNLKKTGTFVYTVSAQYYFFTHLGNLSYYYPNFFPLKCNSFKL